MPEEMVVTREPEQAPKPPRPGEDPDKPAPTKPKSVEERLADLREFHRPTPTTGQKTSQDRKRIKRGATARLRELRKHAAPPPEVDREAQQREIDKVSARASERGLGLSPDLSTRKRDALPTRFHLWLGSTKLTPGHPNTGHALEFIERFLSETDPPTILEAIRARELHALYELGEGARQRGPVQHGPERIKSIGAEHSERETVRDD